MEVIFSFEKWHRMRGEGSWRCLSQTRRIKTPDGVCGSAAEYPVRLECHCIRVRSYLLPFCLIRYRKLIRVRKIIVPCSIYSMCIIYSRDINPHRALLKDLREPKTCLLEINPVLYKARIQYLFVFILR